MFASFGSSNDMSMKASLQSIRSIMRCTCIFLSSRILCNYIVISGIVSGPLLKSVGLHVHRHPGRNVAVLGMTTLK